MSNSEDLPRYLYKYRSLSDDGKSHRDSATTKPTNKEIARNLIVNQDLYFSGPRQLNDPFEGSPFFTLNTRSQAWLNRCQQIVDKRHPHASRGERRSMAKAMAKRSNAGEDFLFVNKDTINRIGIFSLSSDCLNLLMWPHYANDHRGVVIRFDFVALVNLTLGTVPVTPMPVHY